MSRSESFWLGALLSSLAACASPAELPPPAEPPQEAVERRIERRAVVAIVRATAAEQWWIEERPTGIQAAVGDRDLGPRRLVRARGGESPTVVFEPSIDERLTSAAVHPSGEWSATVVPRDGSIALVRASADGTVRARTVLDDPTLKDERGAWTGSDAPERPVVTILSEDSVRAAADGEDLVVSLTTRWNSALVYRWRWDGRAWARGARTLVTPAVGMTPYIPDTASYDVFDAVVNMWSTQLCTDPAGRAYVANWMDRNRIRAHNTTLGTSLQTIRTELDTTHPSDLLVTRIDRDGRRVFQTLVGTPDVDDEAFGIACGSDRVAVVGRHRTERGRDNTEFHVFAAAVASDGRALGRLSFDARQLGLAQSAAIEDDGAVLLGGSEGWAQNPIGASVSGQGTPFLLRWTPGATTATRLAAPSVRGHGELRALARQGAFVWMGGVENGPLSHTYDGDRTQVRSDGWLFSVAREDPR